MNSINCPTCRVSHQLPQEGANYLPNAFHINSLLEVRKKLAIKKSAQKICFKHNDPLRVYCETCRVVICRDCTISEEHNKHHLTCKLISDCYPKHHQQMQNDLDLLKHKTADITTAVKALVTREREVVQQGEEVKEQIHTHAQQLIDQVQRSERQLLQQVDTVVQQKRELLTKQRQQAERAHTQLKTCQNMVEQSLKEWCQLQVMMEKENMLHQINTVSQHVDPTVFHPIEEADTKFTQTDSIGNGIGMISSYRFGESILKTMPCSPNTPSTATLTLQSHDDSPFPLPPSLISCTLSSPGDSQLTKCDITQTQRGKYNISFTPCTTGEHQLIVQVGGVDISGCPFTLPVIPSSVMRGKPVKTINKLNQPMGIAVHDDGDIVVAEFNAHCVTIVNKEGKKVRSFGTKGTKEGQFTYPRGVAISNDGHILVTDKHRLQKMNFKGVCVQIVGNNKSGSGQLQFNYPMGITVHPTTGQIFVADSFNNRIQVFNNDLTLSRTITLHGDKTFNGAWDVSLDSECYLYVAEWGNHCITKLTTTGQYITRFGSKGFAPGHLDNPSSLTINNNLVYVIDFCNHYVSVFDTKGTHIHFGKRGSGEGKFKNPFGITTDTNGNFYLSDSLNNRVIVF